MTTVEVLPPLDVQPEPDDRRFYSVTTIIGVLNKPALLYWSAEQAAEAAVNAAGTLQQRIEEDGRENVVKWLRDAQFRTPRDQRSAADLGTAVHAACESYALTGMRPETDPETAPYVDQFEKWCDTFQPVYQAAELTIFDTQYGYAGTCDAFLTIDGVPLIADYKTSRKSWTNHRPPRPTGPYPEAGLQLAAYRYADTAATWRARRFEKQKRRYYLLSEDEKAMAVPPPEVDGGVVIHITPEHCQAWPVRCDPEMHRAFLFLIEAFRFQNELSKTVVGDALVPQ